MHFQAEVCRSMVTGTTEWNYGFRYDAKGLHGMRKVIVRLTLALIVLGVAAWAVVSHYHSEAEQESDVQRQQREALAMIAAHRNETGLSVVRMASAHTAVTDWTDAFSGGRFAEMLASRELAPVLARKDGRPLLVLGSIVDVVTQDDGCKLEVDAKANLVSNIRFWLTCTPAQVKEALSHREEAREEALEEIREDAVEQGEEETTQEKQDDERRAKRIARKGYAVIARVDSVHSERKPKPMTTHQPSHNLRLQRGAASN
jgi:hypothetical protein